MAVSTLTKAADSHSAVSTGWTNPSNAFATSGDNVYATAAPAKNATVSGDFGFTVAAGDIPAGALILNAKVTVEWKVSNTTSATLGVQFYKSGVAIGTETTFSSTTEGQSIVQLDLPSNVSRDDLVNDLITVRIRDTRGNTNTAHTGSLDFVKLDVLYDDAGAFGTTSAVLDSFDRADSASLGSDWLDGAFGTAADAKILSNQLAANATTAPAYVTTVPDDGDFFIEIPVLSGTNLNILVRCSSHTIGAYNGYQLKTTPGTKAWQLNRIAAGVATLLKSGTFATYASGDAIGLRASGDYIEVWKRDGSSWRSLPETYVQDATYASGVVGLVLWDTTVRLDNLSGPSTDTPMDAAPGSFSVSGAAAGVPAGRVAKADPGSFALTGQVAGVPADRVAKADPGAFALTGAAAGTLAGRVLRADPGAYAVSGVDVTFTITGGLNHYELSADPAAFALSGAAAGALAGRVLKADPATYALTGMAAGVMAGRILGASPGAYTLTGFDADLALVQPGAFALDAEPGSFVLTGAVARTAADRALDAGPGTYALSGVATGLYADRALVASPAAYTLEGAAAILAAAIAARIGSIVMTDAATASLELTDMAGAVVLADMAGAVVPTEASPGLELTERVGTVSLSELPI